MLLWFVKSFSQRPERPQDNSQRCICVSKICSTSADPTMCYLLIASALRKMLDARPRKLENPFEDALARQFVLLTETSRLWEPLPVTFSGPKWSQMPGARVAQFYKICQYHSGSYSAVILGCTANGDVCVIKFRNDFLEGSVFLLWFPK